MLLVVIFNPKPVWSNLNSHFMTRILYQLFAGSLLVVLMACSAPKNIGSTKTDPALLSAISQNMSDAAAQYKVMMQALPPGRFPKTYHPKEARFETSGSDWWCSGFYPGTLLYLHEQTKDAALLAEAERMLALLEKEKITPLPMTWAL